jgi:hypothetical protein
MMSTERLGAGASSIALCASVVATSVGEYLLALLPPLVALAVHFYTTRRPRTTEPHATCRMSPLAVENMRLRNQIENAQLRCQLDQLRRPPFLPAEAVCDVHDLPDRAPDQPWTGTQRPPTREA